MELNDIIIILHLLSISWFITHFEPLTIKLFSIETENESYIKLISILTCWKCLSLWISVIYTIISLFINESTFIFIPLYVSMLAYILQKQY